MAEARRKALCWAAAVLGLWGHTMATAAPAAVSLPAFQSQLRAAALLVQGCKASAAACTANGLPPKEQVEASRVGAPVASFHVDWQWLHSALEAGPKQSPGARSSSMEAAEAHLAEWSQQASGADTQIVSEAREMPAAHSAAERILAGSAFRAEAGPSWFSRAVAWLGEWASRLFLGMGQVGMRHPWLPVAVEWFCFVLAAAGLLFLLWRNLQRQALRLQLGDSRTARVAGSRLDTDWSAEAEAAEAAGQWREAIHNRYWAAIASLEARRAWRPNPARTPREALRLLRPGSEAHALLTTLTRRFEAAWYGRSAPGAAEAEAARGEAATIRNASLEPRKAAKTGLAAAAGTQKAPS